MSNDSKFLGVLNRAIAIFTEWKNDPIAFLNTQTNVLDKKDKPTRELRGRTFVLDVKPHLDKVGRWYSSYRKDKEAAQDLEAYQEILFGGGSIDPDERRMMVPEDELDDKGQPIIVPAIDPTTGQQMTGGIDPATVKIDPNTGATIDAGELIMITERKTKMVATEGWDYLMKQYGEEVTAAISDILELLNTSKEMVEP